MFSRSAWTTYTPSDYFLGGSLLEGDYLYLDLTVSSYDSSVTVSEDASRVNIHNEITMGQVVNQFYVDTPFYIFKANSSQSFRWWIYWVNSTALEEYLRPVRFSLPPAMGVRSFISSFTYSEESWKDMKSQILDYPLNMCINRSSNSQWVISGSDNFTTTDNYFGNRSLIVTYDFEGYLLTLEGGTYFSSGIYFFKYNFSWRRQSKTVSSEAITSTQPYGTSSEESTLGWSIPLILPLTLITIVLFRYIRKRLLISNRSSMG